MNQNQHIAQHLLPYLILAQVNQLGVYRLRKLLFKTKLCLEELVSLSFSNLCDIGLNPQQGKQISQPNNQVIEAALSWLAAHPNHHIIGFDQPEYPQLLKQLSSPPMVLFCRGNLDILAFPQLAMVGARKPSPSGKENALFFAHHLAASGWVVTSGLALGIDGFAHQGALKASGLTIAVLGSGLNHIYPKRNAKLADNIIEQGGCLVSEFFPDEPARAENFPRRNRVVSGMSEGTLVVEAAIKSGSLITARYALEQNREVFAIPGNINNPVCKGCHYLIKQGAKLVECLEDIYDEFPNIEVQLNDPIIVEDEKNLEQNLASCLLLDSVGYEVTPVEVVADHCNLPISDVLAQLLEYELRGLVASMSGGYIKLRGK